MKKFKLNQKEYDCPQNWSEVTLAMQIKVSEDAAKIINNESLQRIALISGYANIPIEELKKTPVTQIQKLFKYLSFINEPLPTNPITEFEFKGEKYYVIDSIINQQFQDWVSIETAFQNHKDEPYKAMPLVLAILAKRKGETLDDYDLIKRAKEFEELPLTIVEPLRVFFSTIGKASLILTQLSLKENQETIINNKLKELKSIVNKQVGGGLFMKFQIGILKLWIKFFERKLRKYFNTIHSKR